MRAAVLGLVVFSGGCSFSASTGNTPGDGTALDSNGDGPPGCTSYSVLFDSCTQTPAGTTELTLAGMNSYNTSNHVLTTPGGALMPAHLVIDGGAGPVDVVFLSSFTLAEGATLRALGERGFMIAASGPVQIDGTLESIGPGAGSRTDAVCLTSTGSKGVNNTGGGGGGGGGGFQGAGGGGSKGDDDGNQVLGGPGGVMLARPAGPTGGCDGGAGGAANGGSGAGGDGGGAVVISSGTSIAISATGKLNVGGSGGRGGGGNGRGGGGGGSGGMILLESANVMVRGVLAANGGGGGEGNTTGNPGLSGLASADPAPGGIDGDGNGGDGAPGSAGAVLIGTTSSDAQNGGGGGGGGGAGYIAIRCPLPMITSSTISPPYMPWP
ncbi:MAG: hypothetical protein M3619_23715 [Myxococcota bacterium]|nr:hypothetical protein [Myxococcota bacterium]